MKTTLLLSSSAFIVVALSATRAASVDFEFLHQTWMQVSLTEDRSHVSWRSDTATGGLDDYGSFHRQTALYSPKGDFRHHAVGMSGARVTPGSALFYNVASVQLDTWEPTSGLGTYDQFLQANARLHGRYAETLIADAAGRTGETAMLTMRFYAPVTLSAAYAEARQPGVETSGVMDPGDNQLSFAVGSAQVVKPFTAEVESVFGDGRVEVDPLIGYNPFTWITTPVTLGEGFTATIGIDSQLFVAAGGDGFGYSTLALEFVRGATFAGAWLRDAEGNYIDDFTLTNEAGVNFRRSFMPVPEPAAYAWAGVALIAAGIVWKRCRRPC